MKIINESLIASPVDMTVGFTLPACTLGNIITYSIQLVFTGAPVGTFKLQCSNDPIKAMGPTLTTQGDLVTHWTDIEGSELAVSVAGDHTWNVTTCGYLWVRVVWTETSGAGNLTSARITAKGA